MFNCGPGQINPNTAADAVGVQDVSIYNYQLFLCGLRYNTSSILVFTGKHMSPETVPTSADSNYTFVSLRASKGTTLVTKQSQIWGQQTVYRLVIHAPASIQVSIALWKLTLKQKGETLFHHSKACSKQCDR
jgi:hypothetical protein